MNDYLCISAWRQAALAGAAAEVAELWPSRDRSRRRSGGFRSVLLPSLHLLSYV